MADMEPVEPEALEPVLPPVQEISTPGYSSPEGEGEGNVMQPIVDDTTAEQQEAAGEWVEGKDEFGETAMVLEGSEGDPNAEPSAEGDSSERRAGDWVALINGAQDQEGLDSVLEEYAASGKDFKTVSDAAEAKQAELDA